MLYTTNYPDEPGTIANMLRRIVKFSYDEDLLIDFASISIELRTVERASSVEEAFDEVSGYTVNVHLDSGVNDEATH